jgi:hypothetical protein
MLAVVERFALALCQYLECPHAWIGGGECHAAYRVFYAPVDHVA